MLHAFSVSHTEKIPPAPGMNKFSHFMLIGLTAMVLVFALLTR
jgi:hypothetical protein